MKEPTEVDKIIELIKELKVSQLQELIKKLKELGIPPETVAVPAKPPYKPPPLPDVVGTVPLPTKDKPHIPIVVR